MNTQIPSSFSAHCLLFLFPIVPGVGCGVCPAAVTGVVHLEEALDCHGTRRGAPPTFHISHLRRIFLVGAGAFFMLTVFETRTESPPPPSCYK